MRRLLTYMHRQYLSRVNYDDLFRILNFLQSEEVPPTGAFSVPILSAPSEINYK